MFQKDGIIVAAIEGVGVAHAHSLSDTCHLLVQQYWLKELFIKKHSPEIPNSGLIFHLLPVEVIRYPGESHPVTSDTGGMKVVVLLTLKQGRSMIYVKYCSISDRIHHQ